MNILNLSQLSKEQRNGIEDTPQTDTSCAVIDICPDGIINGPIWNNYPYSLNGISAYNLFICKCRTC